MISKDRKKIKASFMFQHLAKTTHNRLRYTFHIRKQKQTAEAKFETVKKEKLPLAQKEKHNEIKHTAVIMISNHRKKPMLH